MEHFCTSSEGAWRIAQNEYFSSRYQSKLAFTKPANIFLHEGGIIKLGDMNVSKIT